ncbi:hypothetical protein K5549_002965 [Capra hircus]|nr:hypothetical protein K5549_002965 [Capra hircus]
MYNEQMESKKQELFSNLREFTGPSRKLSRLELGCGTGANFKLYLPWMPALLMAARENMHQVATGSMDVVVCTLVICSVKNQEQILQEVCRVLRPVNVG